VAGVDIELPIADNVGHAVCGHRGVVTNLLLLHEATPEKMSEFGLERCTNMPSREVTLGELATAMKEIAADAAGSLGNISYSVDEELSAIVDGFPKKIDSSRG
jgi:hypothetical protein